ncbi:MAG: 16S rRNA (uracil(1498)-N(3))-methyltransferase [Candidatus Methylomirabilis sp.]|nr:16S rRNA (uracil(1498)-N(3))-methyltransferase [Deltaproteobacteria bacterium]
MFSGLGEIRVERALLPGDTFTLDPENTGRLLSWQPRPGEAFTLIDGRGELVRGRLLSLSGGVAELIVFEEIGAVEPGPAVLLLQALPERERLETIIQKTTELGVTAILPFKSERSISIEELDSRQKRSHNWQKVAIKAAKQSRRWDIPNVLPYAAFREALHETAATELKVMLWESPGLKGLKDFLRENEKPIGSVSLLVGPEGGFTEEEAAAAREEGFAQASLGSRVLRTETAAIFGVGLLRYELGG